MDNLDFLSHLPSSEHGEATLRIILPTGVITSIDRCVAPWAFLDKCPLLFHAFEYGAHNGISQASIEAPSKAAAICLLRFCYTGEYLPPVDQDESQKPDLILHAQVYKLADDFDVPELQVAAYVNFEQDTQLASCLATPPRDLCETIRFLYQHLDSAHSRQEHSFFDSILNYCLCIFKYQKLGQHQDFVDVISEIPQFHKDLCRTNIDRNFEDEGAMDILRLAPSTTYNYKRPIVDFHHEFMYDLSADENSLSGLDTDSEVESSPSKRRRSDITGSTITLVDRSRGPRAISVKSEDESLSDDDDGFTLVHRPKLKVDTTAIPDVNKQADSVLSSPEPVTPQAIKVESIADNEHAEASSGEDFADTSDFESIADSEEGWVLA